MTEKHQPEAVGHGTRTRVVTALSLGRVIALRELAACLTMWDPITAPADPDLIATALAYLRTDHDEGHEDDDGDVGDDEARLLWGRYAYTATRTLFGPTALPALHANRVYQKVLSRQGLSVDAVTVCQQRLAGYRRRGDTQRIFATWIGLVDALHDDGQCDRARREIADLRRAWPPVDPRQARQVVLSQAAIMAGCRHPARAAGILHRNAGLVAGLDGDGRALVARWLAAIEVTHPRVCQYASTPAADAEVGRESWLTLLRRLTGELCPGGTQAVTR